MNEELWWLVAGGAALVTATLLAFLLALAHGLRSHRWWPLALIIVAWLVGMVAYSGWELAVRRGDASPSQASAP